MNSIVIQRKHSSHELAYLTVLHFQMAWWTSLYKTLGFPVHILHFFLSLRCFYGGLSVKSNLCFVILVVNVFPNYFEFITPFYLITAKFSMKKNCREVNQFQTKSIVLRVLYTIENLSSNFVAIFFSAWLIIVSRNVLCFKKFYLNFPYDLTPSKLRESF